MNDFEDNSQLADILTGTSKIPWKELQYFFAGGKVIYVSADLDLVDVAAQIAADNKSVVESWMQNTQLAPVSIDQAKKLYENETTVWAVVVRPWILVQEIKNNPNSNE